MSYTVPAWQNSPSTSTPLSAANLNELSDAITNLDLRLLTATPKKTADYLAAAGQLVPVDTTSGPVTVTLPTAPVDKAAIAVKLVIKGGANSVTIAAGAGDAFNKAGGSTTQTLSTQDQGMWFEYSASSAIWYVVTSDLALSQLDARYATQAFATSHAVALAVVLGS